MKKIIFIALCLIVIPAFAFANNSAFIPIENEDVGEIIIKAKSTPVEKHPCPYYMDVKDPQTWCMKCHVEPSGKLKETNPEATYTYPNFLTSLIFKDGKPIAGRYMLGGVADSDQSLYDALEYFRCHLSGENPRIIIDIHSAGGGMYGMWQMATRLLEARKYFEIETHVDGAAFSAAFVIFLCGEQRYAGKYALLMWHELQTGAFYKRESTSTSMDEALWMAQMQKIAHNLIVEQTKGKVTETMIQDKIKNDREWWMTGKEALELGLATGLLDE